MDGSKRCLNPDEWAEGVDICKDIVANNERRKEAENKIAVLQYMIEKKGRLIALIEERYPKGATKEQVVLCERDLEIEVERKSHPNVPVLRPHLKAPYMIWDSSDNLSGMLDELGIMSGGDSTEYEEATIDILENSIPENTLRAYRGDVRYIGAWLLASGFDPWKSPVNDGWVERFVIDHLTGFGSKEAEEVEYRLIKSGFKAKVGPHKWSTVNRRLGALSNFCRSKDWENPVRSERTRFLLKKLSKKYASNDQPRAINRNILLHMIDQTPPGSIGIRDRALLAFMFASGGRRRVEVEEARIEHIEDQGDCFLFHMQRSKTNKSGQSEPKPIMGVAAQYMREWLEVLGEKEGALFRPITKSGIIKPTALKGAFISRIVKKLGLKAGYDPKEFSAHSLRSGFVSQAAREGCSLPEVKALTGHRTDAMVSHYYQQGDVLRSKAGNLL